MEQSDLRQAVVCTAFSADTAPSKGKLDKKDKKVERLRRLLSGNDLLAAVVGVSGTALGLLESELYYKDNRDRVESCSSTYLNALRMVVSLSTVFLVILILRHYSLSWQLFPSIRKRYFSLGLEVTACLVHWPPYFDWTFSLHQLDGSLTLTGDAVFSLFLLCRLYLLIRLLGGFSKWKSDIAQKACSETGCQASLSFAFKSILQTSPLPLVSLSLVLVVCLCGWALRTFERPYSHQNPIGHNFDSIWNGLWLAILSMTTVGYGDLYPRTHPGRIVAVLAAISGIFVISMMVLVLTKMMDFRNGEMRVCDLMGRLSEKVKVAGRIVHKSLHINRISGLEPISPAYVAKQWSRLRLEMRTFRQVRSFDFPFSDLCAILDDSVRLWTEDFQDHCSSVQQAIAQLDIITALNLEMADKVRRETEKVRERLQACSRGRED